MTEERNGPQSRAMPGRAARFVRPNPPVRPAALACAARDWLKKLLTERCTELAKRYTEGRICVHP